MFFDQKTEDVEYQQMLSEIIRMQRQLLDFRFDWKNRACRPWPPRSLFGKDKKAVARYEEAVRDLEALKQKAAAHRRAQGHASNTYWWTISWELLENFLICDLSEYPGEGNWKFQRDWELDSQDGVELLFLRENGHCSDFSSSSTTNYARESIYSEAEQSDMVSELRRKQKEENRMRTIFSDDRLVYSRRSKTLYASDADYVNSWEHYWNQKDARDRFARSLYTEHITQEVTVVSRSIHYECLFAVGGFHIASDGTLDHVESLDYALCGSRGQVPADTKELYEDRDAMVALAAYLADCSRVRRVNAALFGRHLTDPAPNFNEAMRQAELYTCLAGKITF